MKIIGVIEADLIESDIGTRSRLADDLAGESVLRRTVRRALRARAPARWHVLAPAAQKSQVEQLLRGLDVTVEGHEARAPVWRDFVRSGRKWALEGWRGGVGATLAMDEGFNVPVVTALAQREQAAAVVRVPAAATAVDAALIEAMAERYAELGAGAQLLFSQAPPGLGPTVFSSGTLGELATVGHPPGRMLAYQPDGPMPDAVVSELCFKVPGPVAHTAARLIADTRRSWEMLEALLREKGEEASLEEVCTWARARRKAQVDELPREVEIDLTTEDQLSGSTLRPRGATVGQRGPLAVETVRRIAAEMAEYDDALVVLGGFGEPLLHPQFDEAVRAVREAGVYGVAVRTNGIALNEERLAALREVDVVEVLLDATTAETYRAVHGVDLYASAQAGMERLIALREASGRGLPMISAEMVKVRETMGEMEAFFDGWMRRIGWVNLSPYNSGAGQRAARSVMPMEPPGRRACGRLWTRMMVLADGAVVRCDQDFRGVHAVGHVHERSLGEIWRGAQMTALRAAHSAERWSEAGLCATCAEWHRP